MQWLTMNNYYVLGPCDVIALDEEGNIMKIDIKSESIRKTGTQAGYKIRRMTTELQNKMGIKLLMVSNAGKCYFYGDD